MVQELKTSTIIDHFPGYTFIPKYAVDNSKHNMYRGIDLGFGGYVYSEPGMYTNVALIDAASMHPTSIILLNKLGDHTKRYADLREARVFIKHHDYESAGKLFDGKLKKYLTNDEDADALANALKYPLNAFYGLSSATFDNPARDSRDVNNIIALRGALFMKTLQDAVVERGFKVVSVKTDSLKIPDATPEIVQFVIDFGKKYGYEMEHEATYSKMCLVNDAVYIAKYDNKGVRNKGGKHANEWTATGAQFAQPYVFKYLFTHDPIIFSDLCETKQVKTALYLDFNEDLPNDEHKYTFIGKVGQFTPMKPGIGAGRLVKISKDGSKYDYVTGAKGYRWMESEVVQKLGLEREVDELYYRNLVDKSVEAISKYGNYEWFVSDDPIPPVQSSPLYDFMNIPEDTPEEIPFN